MSEEELKVSPATLTTTEDGTTTSRELTKEEYDIITQHSLIPDEDYQLMVIEEKEAALKIWKMFVTKFKESNIPLRPEFLDKAKNWKKKHESVLCMLAGVTSQNIEAIALVSRKTEVSKFWIELLFTMNPVGKHEFDKMLIESIKNVAKDRNIEVMVPREYGGAQ
jgi:hypothetical protein